MMVDEELDDEVKVFRQEDDDPIIDVDSSDGQLEDDKKEAVKEADRDSAGQTPSISGLKAESVMKPEPSPSFPMLPGLIPTSAFSPCYPSMPIMMPIFMPSPYGLPSPNLMLPMGAALSPSFPMIPRSPFYNPLAAAAMAKQQMESPLMRTGPLNPLNQMRMPPYPQQMNMTPQGVKRTQGGGKVKKEDHIKKPLNAFMWFMKENRKALLEEYGNSEKQSAELNKELGKRWHDLPKEEQQKYFEMAKKDRETHKEKYPQWSARENYAVNKKQPRKKRDRSVASENSDQKKCRAKFGVDHTDKWCMPCKRKKKCQFARSDPSDAPGESSSSPSPTTLPQPLMPMNSNTPQQQAALMHSMLMQMQLNGTPTYLPPLLPTIPSAAPLDANDSDSESDVEEDEEIDPTIMQQTHEVLNQESMCTL